MINNHELQNKNQNKKIQRNKFRITHLEIGKQVEMVVMLGCFEEWGWWVKVLGCRAVVGGSPASQKTPGTAATTRGWGLAGWRERERGERKVFKFWVVLFFFTFLQAWLEFYPQKGFLLTMVRFKSW